MENFGKHCEECANGSEYKYIYTYCIWLCIWYSDINGGCDGVVCLCGDEWGVQCTYTHNSTQHIADCLPNLDDKKTVTT